MLATQRIDEDQSFALKFGLRVSGRNKFLTAPNIEN